MNLNPSPQSFGRRSMLPALVGSALVSTLALAQSDVVSLRYDSDLVKAVMTDAMAENAQPAPQNASPTGPVPFWVDMVNAEANANGGDGVYVAVLDTGLLPQWPFLFPHANIRADLGIGFTHDIYWDPVANDLAVGPLYQTGFVTQLASGHGTHVTSTIVGYRYVSNPAPPNVPVDAIVQGVAPKVSIIPVRVLDAWQVSLPGGGAVRLSGGFDDMISAGIRYVADLAVSQNIKIVINMSLGGPEPTPEIEDAIDYAIARGVIVVASAGNSGTDGMGWPGAYPQVISSAAGGWTEQWLPHPPAARWWLGEVTEKLNSKDAWGNNWQTFVEEFSARPNPDLGQSWKELDVCAPGASIVGPYKPNFSNTVGYYTLWGTSMSAPHVAGMAATLAQAYPGVQQADAERVLKKAATGLPLAPDGAVAFDPFVGGPYNFLWDAHNGGVGFLTLDQVAKTARTTLK